MNPQFLNQLDLSPCPDGRTWRLDQDLVYRSPVAAEQTSAPAPASAAAGLITVPAGFVTDLASIPQLFWNLLPPFGKYTEAAVVHDWLYRNHLYPRPVCDAILLEAMQLCGVNWFQRQLIYRNVRAFGWAAWNGERPVTIATTNN